MASESQPLLPPFPTEGRYKGLVTGYPRIAYQMSHTPELAQFRRFGALNARNLLYLQNELHCLERALKEAATEDSTDSRGMKTFYARDSHCINVSLTDDADARQLNLVLCIREKLKEYSKYVYHFRTSPSLNCPRRSALPPIRNSQTRKAR